MRTNVQKWGDSVGCCVDDRGDTGEPNPEWMLKGPKGARNDREIEERGAEGAKPSAGRTGRILERRLESEPCDLEEVGSSRSGRPAVKRKKARGGETPDAEPGHRSLSETRS